MNTTSETLLAHHSHVVIVTDCEPDDMIALAWLGKFLSDKQVPHQIVVSGWTDVYTKAIYMAQFAGNSEVFMGIPSGKSYDIIELITSPTSIEFNPWTEASWTKSLIIQLAPINELLKMYRTGFEFGTVSVAIYGSFNIRSLLAKKSTTKDEVIGCLKACRQIFFYETYFATDPTQFSLPEIETINTITTIFPHVAKMIAL